VKQRLNVKQRPQLTKRACRRADFSRPWRVETRPTQGTGVSCFGASLLNMDVNVKQRLNVKQSPQPIRRACRRADFSRPWQVETRPTQDTHVSCFGVSLLNMDVNVKQRLNVKQRPQPTKRACRRADFSRPWQVETRPTQGTHVSCFGASLLNMDVNVKQRLNVKQRPQPTRMACRRADFSRPW